MYHVNNLLITIFEDKRNILIHDVYKINETSENVDTVPYGRWNPSTGIYVDDYNIWGRRANLKGFMFRYPSL